MVSYAYPKLASNMGKQPVKSDQKTMKFESRVTEEGDSSTPLHFGQHDDREAAPKESNLPKCKLLYHQTLGLQ